MAPGGPIIQYQGVPKREIYKKYTNNHIKHGHETDLEMSPRPLGTTIFDDIYIRIQV